MVISTTVRINAGLRPTRSAKAPISKLPSGRVKKPTPKAATEASSGPNSPPIGKNACPM